MGALGPLKNSDIDELIGIGTAGQVPVLQPGGGLAYGEATIPSGGTLLAVRGDSDTGLSSPSADVLAMEVGGVEALRVVKSGGNPYVEIHGPGDILGVQIGKNAVANSNQSGGGGAIAIGSNAQAGTFSGAIAVGREAEARSGLQPIAIGLRAESSGTYSVAVGVLAEATHDRGFALGRRCKTFQEDDFCIGTSEGTRRTVRGVLVGSTSHNLARELFATETSWDDSTDASRKSRVKLGAFNSSGIAIGSEYATDGTRGYHITKAHSTAPADSLLPNSSVAFYDDGSGNLAIKLKDSGGTVRTGTVTLS